MKTEIPHDYGTPGSAGATAVGGTWTVCNGTIHVAAAAEDITYHGVTKIHPGTAPAGCSLTEGRINITMRVTGLE